MEGNLCLTCVMKKLTNMYDEPKGDRAACLGTENTVLFTHAVLQSGEHLIAIGLLCTVLVIRDTAPGPESALKNPREV